MNEPRKPAVGHRAFMELLKLGIGIGETSVSQVHGAPPQAAVTNLADVP